MYTFVEEITEREGLTEGEGSMTRTQAHTHFAEQSDLIKL